MSSTYKIHKPYVLETLPKLLYHADGKIVAGEVYGQREDQKKRKRTELAVGVDGEATRIYDVSESILIASHPISPDESFTCSPYSIRIRRPAGTTISRYTYIATKDSTGPKVTLFKDVILQGGKTTSTTASTTLKTSPVRYITCASNATGASAAGDLIAVCQDGEVVSLSGEDLSVYWSASSQSIMQNVLVTQFDKFVVEHATSTTLKEFTEGIFKARLEVFATIPKNFGSNPEFLVLVLRCASKGQETRHSIVLAVAPGTSSSTSDLQKLVSLETVPITSPGAQLSASPSFEVDIQSGLLIQLQDGTLSVYDLASATPKIKSTVKMDDASSFIRLSGSLVLSSSPKAIGLYDYKYRSVLARSPLDLSELPAERQDCDHFELLGYMHSQELVVGLVDNVLVSFQVEPPKTHGKRRKQGLLIDSIGRIAGETTAKKQKLTESPNQTLGGLTDQHLAEYQHMFQEADKVLLKDNDLSSWEGMLREKFRVVCKGNVKQVADQTGNSQKGNEAQELPEWEWLPKPTMYHEVDRRWIIYAIGRVFNVTIVDEENPRPQLLLVLPESNVATYLVVASHLTLSNLKSAFRDELGSETMDSKNLANDLIACLCDADPSMTLLVNYLQATKLGGMELVLTARALMLSMDLVSKRKPTAVKPLKNEAEGDAKEAGENCDMDLDDLERDIAVLEQYLGDDSNIRSRGLTLTFTKLWQLPTLVSVKALKSALQREEIISIMQLLRNELVGGGWTSRYLDQTRFDLEDFETPPDDAISLISDLLSRCVDAIGPGGWPMDDEAADFLSMLNLEVSAALSGVEEAVMAQGFLGELLRAARNNDVLGKPTTTDVVTEEAVWLPSPRKMRRLPTEEQVAAGESAIYQSTRAIGEVMNDKVTSYSLDQIVIPSTSGTSEEEMDDCASLQT